jgi:hypothetical protein
MEEHEENVLEALDFHLVLDLSHDKLDNFEEEGALEVKRD